MTEKGYNYFPLNAVCDYFINGTDTTSHANGPEHNVVFCNEIIKQKGQQIPDYENLSLIGLKLTNSKEWTNFSNLSAYIRHGIEVERLQRSAHENGKPTGSTNLFPEIAYALLTDSKIGAGELLGAAAVNRDAMSEATAFCHANKFYWDGVIDKQINLREFKKCELCRVLMGTLVVALSRLMKCGSSLSWENCSCDKVITLLVRLGISRRELLELKSLGHELGLFHPIWDG